MTIERDTAIHEAGHYVVAEALDLPVAEIHFAPDGRSGFVRFDDAVFELPERSIEGHPSQWPVVVAAVAGGVAESILAGVPTSENRDSYSDGDLRLLENFASVSENGSLDLTPAVERAEAEAREILEARWERVTEIADELGRIGSGSVGRQNG